MNNQEIAKIFSEMALYLEMQDAPFKPQAYKKAVVNLETLSEDVADIHKKDGPRALEQIPGIGKSLAEKIVEYLKTGKIKEHQALRKKMPVNVEELTNVEGIGPKMVRDLYRHLKIKNLKDLEGAAKAGKIRDLPRFGLKTEQNILQGIKFLKRSQGRFLLGEILPQVYKIINQLKTLKDVKRVSEAGSVRRRKETIGDVDILVTLGSQSEAEKVINFFVKLSGTVKIRGKGPTKVSVRLKDGFDVDLRILPEKQFGSALQYFTGSKEHNIVLRKISLDKGLKLSEYGLFRGSKMIAGETEEGVYGALGLEWIPPEMRENTGEIEAAQKHQLPKIIENKDILGDLHIHSNWNGGAAAIKEITQTAIKIGYQYIGIADHTKFLRIEHGLSEKQLSAQRKEIDKINKTLYASGSAFRILQGCEANIMPDGSIDISNQALAKLDYAIAGPHSQFKIPKEKMTERIIRAMKNPHINIISHPTGRILERRDEYQIDFDKILRAARETGTILEINANPARLDLKDINIKKAKQAGVKMVINTDSHHIDQLRFIEYGIAQARRGWAEKKDIINCWPVRKLLKMIKVK